MAELVRYVSWVGMTTGRQRHGTHLFQDLVHGAGRPRDLVPEMADDKWRRMPGQALPGVDLDGPMERGRRPRGQILRELLQTEGQY